MYIRNINQSFIVQAEKLLPEDFVIIQDNWGSCDSESCAHISHSPYQDFKSLELGKFDHFWSNDWDGLYLAIISINDNAFIVYSVEDMGYHYMPKFESFIFQSLKESLEKALTNFEKDSNRYQPKKELLKYLKRFE